MKQMFRKWKHIETTNDLSKFRETELGIKNLIAVKTRLNTLSPQPLAKAIQY